MGIGSGDGRKTRLAIYLPTMAGGGAERLHLNLAPAFVAAGLDVTFLLHRAEGSLMPFMPAGVRVESFECGRTLAAAAALARALTRDPPDILLSNLPCNNLLALGLAGLVRSPARVIVSFHNTVSAEVARTGGKYRALPPLFRLLLPRAPGIVAVSRGVADDLAATCRLPRDRIDVIYNPVVTPDFDERMAVPPPHPWFLPGRPPVILGVGRLNRQKDFATLLAAFARAARARDARLMILGEGSLGDELAALAASLGVADRVALPGFVPDPLPYMRRAALFVLSSLHEGFGNVLVEALACGTPVVSTDCPSGPAEILDRGRFGRLVPVGDHHALAAAMLATLDRPPPPDLLRARGREFTVERAAAEYLRLFERAAAGR